MAKDFLKRRFEEWYLGKVMKQLDGQLRCQSILKKTPQIIISGFIRAGIADALDQASGVEGEPEIDPESESDFCVSDKEQNDMVEIGDD